MRWIAVVALLAACGGSSEGQQTPTERIVPVDGDLAEVVFALGLGDQVVATDLSATYPPEADALPQIGYQRALTAEPIAAFEPTLVLATNLAGPPETLDQLRALDIPVTVIERWLRRLTSRSGRGCSCCGDDDDDAASATTATAPTTTEAPATTGATGAGDEEAAIAAFTAVFDSAVPFADKAAHLENADALQTAAEAYIGAGSAMGGITLDPTNVVIDGDTATVTYDVLFGGQAAYQDLSKSITRTDGVWIVPQAAFCEFLSSARVPCP